MTEELRKLSLYAVHFRRNLGVAGDEVHCTKEVFSRQKSVLEWIENTIV